MPLERWGWKLQWRHWCWEEKNLNMKILQEIYETNEIFFLKQTKKFHTMKVNYDKAIQVNKELKVNVDDQQVDMKHLKGQCDRVDEVKF